MIRFEHNSYTESNTFDRKSKSYTYTGLEAEIKELASSFVLGSFVEGKGSIDKVEVTQKNSVFWNCKIDYVQTLSPDGTTWSNGSDEYGKKRSTITARLQQVELETHPNYLYNWNHALWQKIALDATEGTTPAFWVIATDSSDTKTEKDYCWTDSETEPPSTSPNDELAEGSEANLKQWILVEERQKKSDAYEVVLWEIHEKQKCSSQSAVGTALAKAGKITSPTNGDFNRTGNDVTNWRCDGGNGYHDGKNWVADTIFTGSPHGWDTTLYPSS